MVETKFDSKAMQLFTFLQCLRVCTCLVERREVIVIRDEARAYDIRKEHNGSKRGVRAGEATGHGVQDHNIWLGNLVE